MPDVLRFPTPAERCWECGGRATRIAPTAAPEDLAPPLGCDECYPQWPTSPLPPATTDPA